MRAIVETTGNHMFIHPKTREVVEAHRPSIVLNDDVLHHQVGLRSLRILARNLPKEATDEEWAKWLKESDDNVDLAVASYVAQFEDTNVVIEGEEKEEKPQVITETVKPKKK